MREENKQSFLIAIAIIRKYADFLGMIATSKAAQSAIDAYADRFSQPYQLVANETPTLTLPAEQLLSSYFAEIQSHKFIAVDVQDNRFFSESEAPFGSEVDLSFPSASAEIRDAGRCRAMGLWTASVLHLMRALEPALAALASHVGVPREENWNQTLNQIDSKLKQIQRSTDGTEAEQWASEASAHLRVIKNAWRNHAAHARTRYDEEQAIAIYDNVRPLMRTLSKRLSE
jgi:hypothetical protein